MAAICCTKCGMTLLWPIEQERHKCPDHKPKGETV